jgi:spore germination cell wall hydrolase CwlJ-like protein
MRSEIQILARTVFGEARGEYQKVSGGISALIAIANVVINRVNKKTWYGQTVSEVCLKPSQFSCWNTNDPNFPVINKDTIEDPIFNICLTVADKVIKGEWPDLLNGCDSYYAASMKDPPYWAQGKKPKRQIGQHLFFDI